MMDTLQQKSPSVNYQPGKRLNIIAGLELKTTYRKTLLVVDSFLNSTTGACFPSVKTIAKRRGLSERATQYHLRKLEGFGLLERTARHEASGRQRSNLFVPSYVQLAHPYAGGVSDTGRRQKLHPPPPVSCTPVTKAGEQIEPKPKEVINTPIVTDGGLSLSDYQWRAAYDVVADFLNTDHSERGLLSFQFGNQAKLDKVYAEACDRLGILWRWEP